MRTGETIEGNPVLASISGSADPDKKWQAWVHRVDKKFPCNAAYGSSKDAAIAALKAKCAMEAKEEEI